MSEMGESYDPGPWTGFDFKSARAAYDPHAGRGYGGSSSGSSGRSTALTAPSRTLDDLVPARISTTARSPLVIAVDGTGSMGDFPQVMFEKLPLLDLGIKDYLDDSEISFAMVGDADGDRYPLQVRPFTKGKGLVDALNKLTIEGGGGGNMQESYDLAGLYYAHNADMPNATKPIFIWVCDEGVYDSVDKDWASQHARTKISKNLPAKDLFEDLKRQYSMYCIRKHYGNEVDGETMTGNNLRIQKQWESYVGADRVKILNDPRRIVDVIFGILALETGREEFFEKELMYRQEPDQVATVMKSVFRKGTVKKSVVAPGASVMTKRKLPPGAKTGSLL